jgi:transglutaminase-like putative cysteine protease
MKLQISCQLNYKTQENVPLVLMLHPRSDSGQWVGQEEYLFTPEVPVTEYTDLYGNLCQRLVTPIGDFSIKTSAIVDTSDHIEVNFGAEFVPVENLPDYTLLYLLPSRYCESDRFSNMVAEITQNLPLGYPQVEAIRQWVSNNVTYQYGYSSSSSSACDINLSRIGVCRDFSHLGIALCRALNIPARMVVGYLHDLNPMDLHAWFEAYLGGKWYTFDATQAEPKGNRVVLAYGRDAADVALATQFGNIQLVNMFVSVNPA